MVWRLRYAGATWNRAAQSASTAFSAVACTEPVSRFYAPARPKPATRVRTCNYAYHHSFSRRTRSECESVRKRWEERKSVASGKKRKPAEKGRPYVKKEEDGTVQEKARDGEKEEKPRERCKGKQKRKKTQRKYRLKVDKRRTGAKWENHVWTKKKGLKRTKEKREVDRAWGEIYDRYGGDEVK